MNVLLLTSHSIAEYDDLRMLSDLGYDVFSIGAYTNPGEPGDDKRPALPDVPYHPELEALCWEQRSWHGGDDPGFVIDWAKGDLHPAIVDWADAIIVHHFPEAWIAGQWDRIRDKRVIWRTCGQSDPRLEAAMARLDGLEIVRYSPKERNLGNYAGETALIRFGKYPEDWGGWTGHWPVVGNVSQHAPEPHGRDDALNWRFWEEATQGLPRTFAGPHSEKIGGIGALSYDEMRDYLRRIRAYLYTGTQPASYTLGLIEAMMTGVPVVSIGPGHMTWQRGLFEGHELVQFNPVEEFGSSDDPGEAREMLRYLLESEMGAAIVGAWTRATAIELFGIETVGPQWREFLGDPGPQETDLARLEWRVQP
jgi:glycosyltransferase involved in cell wall biosynthesis